MILDGWGISPDPEVSAIEQANTPFIDGLYDKYPNAQLRTDGLHVGLPEGQMGNSEVGHMNLGAGRIVYQDLVKINLAVKNKTLQEEAVVRALLEDLKATDKALHLLGLLSDGGVHSHIDHVFGLLEAAAEYGLEKVYVHAFTDGRDVDPKSGYGFVSELEEKMASSTGKLATICGRYYAMDRDNRWERIKLSYDAMVNGVGQSSMHALKSIQDSYDEGITDEFLKPIVMVDEMDQPIKKIQDGDAVLFFNFRTDRGRQLTQALTQNDYHEQNMHRLELQYVTMTEYDETFENINVIYEKDNLKDTLGEVLEVNGKRQLRIAETEKYPHVTFFFSGGNEVPFKGEDRILKDSPKVATYDLKPEMSAHEITEALVNVLKEEEQDFICLNFANGDMVGHTGVMRAAIQACEAVDNCVKQIVETGLEHGYSTILIADHGNCDTMLNPDGSPHTAHTTNPVPIILIDPEIKSVESGILGDIAPTILEMMGIEKPKLMTQNSLI